MLNIFIPNATAHGVTSMFRHLGALGLLAARENIPHLILLDMMLPKISGLDVLRTLKGDVLLKHIPVIVFSGLGQANEDKLLNEGATAFLVKSEKSLENNSSALIQAVDGVRRQQKRICNTGITNFNPSYWVQCRAPLRVTPQAKADSGEEIVLLGTNTIPKHRKPKSALEFLHDWQQRPDRHRVRAHPIQLKRLLPIRNSPSVPPTPEGG
jgi:CheY-like chemotaxis protein